MHGVVYLHRISDNRMGGTATRSFRFFRKICGDDVMSNVVIVTNMWSKVGSREGATREQQLMTDDRFFKPAIDRGARIFRHDHTSSSALDILRPILDNHPQPFAIQRELVNEFRHLCDTEAGREVNHSLRTFTRKCTEDMISLKAELEVAMRQRDKKAEDESLAELQKLTTGLARAKEELALLTLEHRAQMNTSFRPKSSQPQIKVENIKEGRANRSPAAGRIVIHHKPSLVCLFI